MQGGKSVSRTMSDLSGTDRAAEPAAKRARRLPVDQREESCAKQSGLFVDEDRLGKIAFRQALPLAQHREPAGLAGHPLHSPRAGESRLRRRQRFGAIVELLQEIGGESIGTAGGQRSYSPACSPAIPSTAFRNAAGSTAG